MDKERKAQSRENETLSKKTTRQALDRERTAKRRKLDSHNNPTFDDIKKAFDLKVQCGPIYACICCHRLLYKHSVIHLNIQKYKKVSRSDCVELFSDEFSVASTAEKSWICHNCDIILKKGKIPGQATLNNLALKKYQKNCLVLIHWKLC